MSKLEDLPLRCIVAYAVRCAMRARLLYDQNDAASLDEAISVAQMFCLGKGATTATTAQAASAASAAAADARAAFRVNAAEASAAAASAAEAASAAASSAAEASAAEAAYVAGSAATISARYTNRVAMAAAYATTASADAGASYATAAIDDLTALAQLNLGQPSEVGEPIDPSEDGPLGPLWAEGAALKNPSELELPSIELYVDPGEASKETIQAVLDALSDLHIAAGGLGLEYTVDGHFILAPQEVAE